MSSWQNELTQSSIVADCIRTFPYKYSDKTLFFSFGKGTLFKVSAAVLLHTKELQVRPFELSLLDPAVRDIHKINTVLIIV